MQSIARWFTRRLTPAHHTRLKSDRQILTGIPDGITFDTLNQLCLKHQDQPLTRASYAHISGWKSSGAFLLWLHLHNGAEWRVVYKNAVYTPDDIPAVIGLPVRPGPPEYTVYSQGSNGLADYLPAVYLSEEVTPGKHYHYVMEDISANYRPLTYKSAQIMDVAANLSSLHEIMKKWAHSIEEHHLLRFGETFSMGLVEYARTNLERYARVVASPMVLKVNQEWMPVIDAYLRHRVFAQRTLGPVHGDFSPANIYLSREEPSRLKILDWEWAGVGVPHADLAALLKRADPKIEQRALARYVEHDRTLSPDQHRQVYEWCQLERGLLDAAYLAKQYLDAPVTTGSIPRYIERSLQRSFHAIRYLS
jgi:hypothetical protein